MRKKDRKRQRRSNRKPQSKHVTLLFASLVGTALLSIGVGLGYRMMQTQKRLELVQGELDGARRLAHKAEAEAAAVKNQLASLKLELDKLNANRAAFQAELNLAHSDVEQLRTTLNRAQSEATVMRSRLKVVQSDLEASKQAAVQAKAKAAKFEDQATKLQSELESGRAERDELRKELDRAKASLKAKSPPLEPRRIDLSIDSEARDYLIRTIVFEAAGETEIGKAAVAHVILNRKRIGRWGDKIQDVVTHPWQFEPWMTRRDEIEKLSPKDPRYQDAAYIADAVFAGRIPDPTAGATHFLNPVVVRKRRDGSLPSWTDGQGRPFGRHVFYSPHDAPQRAEVRGLQPTTFRDRRSDSLGAG